jgi:ribonuclease P protein component
MLAKKNRLNRQEVNLLKKAKSKVIQGRFFGLVAQFSDDSKFGLIVSNKVVPGAVKRNQIKRSLYLAIEKNDWKKKGLFLFLAKKEVLKATKLDLIKEIEEIKQKIIFD